MKNFKPVVRSEYDEQCAFIEWFRYQYPILRIFSIPNGMRVSIGTAIKGKKSGVLPGLPDLMIPRRPDMGINANIWIEFKRTKGGVVSPVQKDWHEYLTDKCDDVVIIAKGCEDGIKKLMALSLIVQRTAKK